MSKRQYKIDEQIVRKYMRKNYLAETQIVGETDTSFMIKKGNGSMQSLTKDAVESWALNEGLVSGLGTAALSPQDKAIFEANKATDSTSIAAKKNRELTSREENIEKYNATTKEHRLKQARESEANKLNTQSNPQKGVHYK